MALAALTITLGLGLQAVRGGLQPDLADILGDALWALMIYWFIGAMVYTFRVLPRAALALLMCWAVEFSQLYHTPLLDSWRATTLGHLVLGSGFDPRDLASYGLGVLVGVRLELTWLQRFVRQGETA